MAEIITDELDGNFSNVKTTVAEKKPNWHALATITAEFLGNKIEIDEIDLGKLGSAIKDAYEVATSNWENKLSLLQEAQEHFDFIKDNCAEWGNDLKEALDKFVDIIENVSKIVISVGIKVIGIIQFTIEVTIGP